MKKTDEQILSNISATLAVCNIVYSVPYISGYRSCESEKEKEITELEKENEFSVGELERAATQHLANLNKIAELEKEIADLKATNEGITHDATRYSEELARIKQRLAELETFEHEGKFYVKKEDTDTIYSQEVIE